MGRPLKRNVRRWIALIGCLLCLSGPASGEVRRTVLIWSAPDDSLARRLRAELEVSGFGVVSLAPPTDVSRALIERSGREHAASTVVRFLPTAGEVQFWTIDRLGAAALRDVLQSSSESDEDILARRAAELVRTGVGEHGPTDDTTLRGLETSDSETQSPNRSAKRDFSVALGPGLLANPRSTLSLQALLSGEWRAFEQVAAYAFLLVPVSAARLEAAEGSARVRTFIVGSGARLYLTNPSARWRPNVGVGAGLGWIQFDGSASPAHASRSTDQLTVVAYGTAGLAFALTSHVAVAAEGHLGVATPSIGVRIAEREVATWGLPWFLGSVAGVVSW